MAWGHIFPNWIDTETESRYSSIYICCASFAPHGMQDLSYNQGLDTAHLLWKCTVLTTGPQGLVPQCLLIELVEEGKKHRFRNNSLWCSLMTWLQPSPSFFSRSTYCLRLLLLWLEPASETLTSLERLKDRADVGREMASSHRVIASLGDLWGQTHAPNLGKGIWYALRAQWWAILNWKRN